MLVFAPDDAASCGLIAKAILAILLSISAAQVASALHRKLRIAKGLASVPGPKGWPLLGILPDFTKNVHRHNDFFDDLMVEYGGRMKQPWNFFSDGMICLASPEDVKHVLATNVDNYIRAPRFLASMDEVFGNGLALLNHAHTADGGAMWRLQRKVVSKVLSAANFKLFSDQVFYKYAMQIAQQIKAQNGKCDMSTLASQYTLQSIFDVSCGVPLAQVDDQLGLGFVESLSFVVQHISARIFTKPYFKYFWWCMPDEYRYKREAQVLRKIANEILDRRLLESEGEIAPRSDIMSLFIKKARELSAEEDFTSSSSPVLDVATLRAIFLSLIWAGWDTTSSAITYTFYALALYPEVQEKLYEEIGIGSGLHETGGGGGGGDTYDSLKKFVYLDAVVNEAMRVYTTLPMTMKLAAEDDYLPDGTFIPAGVEVAYSPWYMARHSPIWGERPAHVSPRAVARDEDATERLRAPDFPGGTAHLPRHEHVAHRDQAARRGAAPTVPHQDPGGRAGGEPRIYVCADSDHGRRFAAADDTAGRGDCGKLQLNEAPLYAAEFKSRFGTVGTSGCV